MFGEQEDDLEAGGGILSSAGLRDYDNVSTRVTPEGVTVKLNCRRCNRPHIITLEWPEVVAVSNNGPSKQILLPRGWTFSQQNNSPYLSMKCPSCGNDTGFAVHLPVVEAQEHVKAGVSSGVVPQEVVHNVVQSMEIVRRRG